MKTNLYPLSILVPLSLVVVNPKNTLDSSLETCGKWTIVPDTSTKSTNFQPHIYSEHTCLLTCMGHPSCKAADFDPKVDRFDGVKPTCHLHYANSKFQLLTGDKGNRYWTFDRTSKCRVECMFAFAAVSNHCSASNGTMFGSAPDTWTCRKECIRNTSCVGYDWFEDGVRGEQCFLVFVAGDLVSIVNAFHYEFDKNMRARCNATEPILGQPEPDGSNTKIAYEKKSEHVLANDFLWMKITIGLILVCSLVRAFPYERLMNWLLKRKAEQSKPEGEQKALKPSN